jgi:hypothetical protein
MEGAMFLLAAVGAVGGWRATGHRRPRTMFTFGTLDIHLKLNTGIDKNLKVRYPRPNAISPTDI